MRFAAFAAADELAVAASFGPFYRVSCGNREGNAAARFKDVLVHQ